MEIKAFWDFYTIPWQIIYLLWLTAEVLRVMVGALLIFLTRQQIQEFQVFVKSRFFWGQLYFLKAIPQMCKIIWVEYRPQEVLMGG